MNDQEYLKIRNSLDQLHYSGMYTAIFTYDKYQAVKQKTIDSFGDWTGILSGVKIIYV